jgi:hypothetical protein
MQPPVEVALIAATPPTLVALGGAILGFINRGKIKEIHLSINSRLDELIKASVAQGRQEERDSQIKP